MASAPKNKVFLIGATGETGSYILDGLLEAGIFDVTALIRPSSVDKPAAQALKGRGVSIYVGSMEDSIPTFVSGLTGQDVVICAIGEGQLLQLNLAEAASQAGIKRFVPCAFLTVTPPGGVMMMRDQKEEVYQRIRKLYLPYTIIDIGFWLQTSFPPMPSGIIDHAIIMPLDTIYGDGNQKTLLIDARDIGRYVAKIIVDERTLNKSVVTHAENLSQNEIFARMEEFFGEKIDRKYQSHDEAVAVMKGAQAGFEANPGEFLSYAMLAVSQYAYSKYVRGDNTPEHAEYFGYLSTRDLYPDFNYVKFDEFLVYLKDGKMKRPYLGRF